MNVQIQKFKNATVIRLSGRFDSFQVAAVKQEIDAAVQRTPNVVIDLEAVNFMDSAALAALVQGMKHCRQAKGDLRVCNLQQPVKVIFELTRLDKAFTLFNSRDEAVMSFK